MRELCGWEGEEGEEWLQWRVCVRVCACARAQCVMRVARVTKQIAPLAYLVRPQHHAKKRHHPHRHRNHTHHIERLLTPDMYDRDQSSLKCIVQRIVCGMEPLQANWRVVG